MTKIIGIDLGTTYSAIAELDDLGNPEVLSDPENNNRITRSAVYIGREKAIVGDKAVDAAVTNRKNTILEVKSAMENNVVWSPKEIDWVEEKKSSKGYAPSQISSIILSKLKDYTSGVKKVVVTVPAMFAETARAATIDAAKLAKLDVELINEPTAAVLHYANLPGSSVNGRVLIFDLGGGTFDITIANVKGKKVDVITSVGDKHLGGRRFDEEIIKILDKKLKGLTNTASQVARVLQMGIDGFSKGLAESIVMGKELNITMKELGRTLLTEVLATLIKIVAQRAVMYSIKKAEKQMEAVSDGSGLGSVISGVFGSILGKKASGGSVLKGQPYMVGEQGAELFVPNQSGQIQQSARGGNGGATTVNFNINTLDASGFDELLIRNRGTITQLINNAVNERGSKNLI